MQITLLGATGPTGRQLLTLALARDVTVVALVRDPARLAVTDPRLTVVVGDATDPDALTEAMQGSDAVVSALGAGRSRHSDIASRAAVAVTGAAGHAGVERVVWLSALGVGSSRADGSGVQRFMWKALMGEVFADKEIADRTIAGSGMTYTLVYPTTLTNKPGGTPVVAAHLPSGTRSIGREALAAFMLDQLTSDAWRDTTVEVAA